jgi:hypothetical protein
VSTDFPSVQRSAENVPRSVIRSSGRYKLNQRAILEHIGNRRHDAPMIISIYTGIVHAPTIADHGERGETRGCDLSAQSRALA